MIKRFIRDSLTVAVEAAYSKHRQEDIQPLRPELAADLTLSSSEKQRQLKNGTYDAEKSLPISCFSDGQQRTPTVK